MVRLSTEAKQCLLCGSARSTKFRFHSNLSRENDLCRSYHETENLYTLASNIIPKQRAIVFGRINALRSPITRLPIEIVHEIFEAACLSSRLDQEQGRPWGTDHFQVVLAGVSSYWRSIILSSPLFWAQLSLDFEQNGRKLFNRLDLLRLYLTHSGSIPLNLKFSFSASRYNSTWPDSDTLIDRIIDKTMTIHLSHIRELRLERASQKWIAYTPQMSQLISFSYTSNMRPYNNSPILFFPNSGHLQKLALTDWLPIEISYAMWTDLSILVLESMEVNMCASLLLECINLVEFRCKTPKSLVVSSWIPCQPWKSRVTRHYLEVFEWDMPRDGRPGAVEMSMLVYIDLPALRSLRLNATKHSQHKVVRVFCEHLPLTMTKLHLTMTCGEADNRDQCLFKFIPRNVLVDDLTLCYTGCPHFLAHAFMWMEDPTYFPKLRHMTIETDDIVRETESRYGRRVILPPNYGFMIYQMISPRAPSLPGFYLKFPWITVEWPEDVKNHFWMMVENLKFRLTIQEDRMPFNSLPRMYTE